MKKLRELLIGLDVIETVGNLDVNINSICADSRSIERDSLFVAISGERHDGHNFINNIARDGAIAIVHDKKVDNKISNKTYVYVRDSRIALAQLAQNFYDHPSTKLRLVGVTGTNGKTTTATLLFDLFRELGFSCALLSTVGHRIGDAVFPTILTTPDSITITSLLNQAVKQGCEYAFMECSSHAIDQKRVWGLKFDGAVFTNLTHDHLDYHHTMEAYAVSKKELFDQLDEKSFAVINADDTWGEYMASETRAKKYFFSLKDADLKQSIEGLSLNYENKNITSKLVGAFNAYNIIGVYIAATLLGLAEDKVISALAKLKPPKGRLEFLEPKNGVLGIIDFAHTPDALEKTLETIRNLLPEDTKIITIVGCSGERDTLKRPIMGKIAYELSDYAIFSSDNPQSENPEQILKEIIAELPKNAKKYWCEPDRAKSILLAFNLANKGDVILMAGKGHEDYQLIGDKKIHFSEREVWEAIP